jgi:hypothetical protein
LDEFGVEHDRCFYDRSVGTVKEVGLGYKYVDSADELDDDTCTRWIRLGGRKSVGAEIVC